MEHPPNSRLVIARPPCELCSSPYRFKAATQEVAVPMGGATARLCDECSGDFTGPRRLLIPAADAAPLLTEEEAAKYVSAEFWTLARTVPEDPHEYLLLRISHDQWTHLRLIRYIREVGEKRTWRRSKAQARQVYSYWRSGDYEYWPMATNDTLINRRSLPPLPGDTR